MLKTKYKAWTMGVSPPPLGEVSYLSKYLTYFNQIWRIVISSLYIILYFKNGRNWTTIFWTFDKSYCFGLSSILIRKYDFFTHNVPLYLNPICIRGIFWHSISCWVWVKLKVLCNNSIQYDIPFSKIHLSHGILCICIKICI